MSSFTTHTHMVSLSKTGLPRDEKEIYLRKSIDLGIPEPDPPFCTKTSLLQLGYGIWVNLTLVNIGLCLEFSAVAIPQLKLPNSTINMTNNQEAAIASILTLSSPIGCIISGIILDRCGRTAGLIWCHVPIAFGWFYMAFAAYARDIIIGRVITGIGVGMAMAAPKAYITEITLPNMRGVLGAFPNLAMSIGLTVQAVLGLCFEWRFMCFLSGSYAAILLVVNKFLPETPYYVLMKSNAPEAKLTLKKFRSLKYSIDAEIQSMEEYKTVNNIRRLTLCKTRKALFKPASCKPFSIVMFYVTLAQFVGINIVTTWAVEILQESRSSVDASLGNVILAVTRIVFGIFTAFLLYKVERRPLALVTAVAVGIVGITFGTYLHLSGGGWYPLAMLVAFVAFSVPGYHTLPTLMMFEMFPLQVRGILSGIVLSCKNLVMAGTIHLFPTMRDSIGLANTFTVYGVISILGAIVLYLILPETKELTLPEIEEYYNNRRSTLTSERLLLAAQIRSQLLSANLDHSTVQKQRKGKHIQIIAPDDGVKKQTSVGKKEKTSSIDIPRQLSDVTFDDIITVYEEDAEESEDKNNEDSVERNKEVSVGNSNGKENKDHDTEDDVGPSKKDNIDHEIENPNKEDKADSSKKNNEDNSKT